MYERGEAMETPNYFADIWSPQPWEQGDSSQLNSQAVLAAQSTTPANHGDPINASTPIGTPAQGQGRPSIRKRQRQSSEKLPLFRLEDWREDKTYDEDPPICIRYYLGFCVAHNKKTILKDTKPNLVLALCQYWQLFLRPKLERVVQQSLGDDNYARVKETSVMVSVTAHSEYDLTKRFDGLEIEWNEVQDQLIEWSDHFRNGKKFRVDMIFKYMDADVRLADPPNHVGNRRGAVSAT